MNAPFIRTPYNYDRDQASDLSGLSCGDPSRAQQNFKEQCDINTIMKTFARTGQLPSNVRMPTVGDFTDTTDFMGCMNAIRMAQESFDAMPAELRKRFHNDPAEFVAFCSDESNRDEAVKYGLVPPSPPPASPADQSNPPPAD